MVFIAAHKVKNLNWPEANRLAIYKRDWNVELTMRTNPASSSGRDWTRGVRITIPALEPFNNAGPRQTPRHSCVGEPSWWIRYGRRSAFVLATLEQRTVLSSSDTERQIIHTAILAFVAPNEDILLYVDKILFVIQNIFGFLSLSPPPPPPTLFLSFVYLVVPKYPSLNQMSQRSKLCDMQAN